ncbi:MAG: DUF5063 domain-containing protein [Verrucomicrobiales bacterium]|nr:DUF5063 domain-containing protein [Verrucomicrobiales bacterium]
MSYDVLLKMSLAIESFILNIEQFCEWASAENHDYIEAIQLLLSLMSSVPHLQDFRYKGSDEISPPSRSHERWKADHENFSDLPFQYHQVVFDPHDLNLEETPVTGDLHDDLADILGDLWSGLELHRSGHKTEALSHWIDSYCYHWGHHASSELRALDEFYRKEQK